jgi:hypothetical protein
MYKGTTIFIAGAALGIIGYSLVDSPFNPFRDWIENAECVTHYAKELNMTPTEFEAHIEQLKQKQH